MHAIRFISDEEMPEGHNFVFVEIPNGALVFIRESALVERTFEEAWDAYRAAKTHPPVEPTSAPVVDLVTTMEDWAAYETGRDCYERYERDARAGSNWQLYVA